MQQTRSVLISFIVLTIALFGCSLGSSPSTVVGTTPTASAPTNTPAPTSTPAPTDCGQITTLPGGTPQGNPTPAESCFATAFQTCHPALLEYIFSGIDSTTDYKMSIQTGNGTCTIAVNEDFTSASGSTPTNSTSNYTCSTIGQQAGKYVVSQCGSNPDIDLP